MTAPLTLLDDSNNALRAEARAWIAGQRHLARQRGARGACYEVALAINHRWAIPMFEGAYQSENGEIIAAHRWNILPDGAIVDGAADQFCEGGDVDILTDKHPRWARYRPIFTSALNPVTTPWLSDLPYVGCSDQQWQDQHPDCTPNAGWWLKDSGGFVKWREQMEQRYESFKAKPMPAHLRKPS